MDYAQDILTRLIKNYEGRKLTPAGVTARAVALDIPKVYPAYSNPHGEQEELIAGAIEALMMQGFVRATKNQQGYYGKVTLEPTSVSAALVLLGRIPKSTIRRQQMDFLQETVALTNGAAQHFCTSQIERLQREEPLEFGLDADLEKLQMVLIALEKLTQLTTETYIRNFSEAIFHDSKQLKKIQGKLRRILVAYAEGPVDKRTVLAQYNLLENPAYIYLKGGWRLHYGNTLLEVAAVPGGVGIPSASLGQLSRLELVGDRVLSVENLTTFHDASEEPGTAVLYLGGFQNTVRTQLLKRLYQEAPHAAYCHKGDLDPYGFMILENLRSKTGIPFCAMEMELETLQQCYKAGHYRKLNTADKKLMQHPALCGYSEIFQFMLENNCKVEQESFAAMALGI